MSTPLVVLVVATAIGSAAVGGVFFAFSTFVMPALSRLPASHGIAAMQAINVTAQRPPLMLLMLGTTLACVALVVLAVVDQSPWLVAGAAVYLVGAIVVTAAYNVPRNLELAALDAASPDAAARWLEWESEWTAGNHVRTIAGLAAAALLLQAVL
ncbi:anthrone oxygenase family protein [Cellulomonas sp. P5_C5]